MEEENKQEVDSQGFPVLQVHELSSYQNEEEETMFMQMMGENSAVQHMIECANSEPSTCFTPNFQSAPSEAWGSGHMF